MFNLTTNRKITLFTMKKNYSAKKITFFGPQIVVKIGFEFFIYKKFIVLSTFFKLLKQINIDKNDNDNKLNNLIIKF